MFVQGEHDIVPEGLHVGRISATRVKMCLKLLYRFSVRIITVGVCRLMEISDVTYFPLPTRMHLNVPTGSSV